MSYENKFSDWKERVIKASNTTPSAAQAAALLGIKYHTYKRYAIKYNCFITNQSGKGTTKNSGKKISHKGHKEHEGRNRQD